MKKIKRNNEQIYCMYCGYLSAEGPKQNRLLLDLLWEQYINKYNVESLPTTDIVPGRLSNDIKCRVIHLKSLIQTLKGKLNQNIPIPEPIDSEIKRANMLIGQLEQIKNENDKFLSTDIDDKKLNDYLNEYIKLLTGDGNDSRKCEYFISICEQLLYYDKEAEFEKHFPLLKYKMNEWEHALITDEQFQPKIIEAFKAVQSGLGQYIIPSVPCRVGFIGDISVGKTSLLNWLREIRSNFEDDQDSQNKTAKNNILVSPVRVGKSTYCRLEFEHKYSNDKKIIFVDVEGSTDTDSYLKSANYFDEIVKAECDLYIIVFDHQFTDIQQQWYDYIVNDLHRECWIVRSKVDGLFRDMFREDVHQDFHVASDEVKNKYAKKIFETVKKTASLDINGKKLPNIYLTFTSYDEKLSQILYSESDMEKLTKDIQQLPLSLNGSRLRRMAVCAMARVINNCFRRGYVVNVMKYKIAAGIAAVIPLGDLVPRYYGREKIRQAFGVNTRSRFMNWIKNTTDEFKDYLKEFDIAIDESGFKTSAFNTTFKKNPVTVGKTAKNVVSAAGKGAAAIGVAGVSVTDDVLRGVGVSAITAVRGVSTAFIVVGAVLTVGMCAWAAVSNGKQMYNYLNRLCDDLIIVSDYVITKTIDDNDAIRDFHINPE